MKKFHKRKRFTNEKKVHASKSVYN